MARGNEGPMGTLQSSQGQSDDDDEGRYDGAVCARFGGLAGANGDVSFDFHGGLECVTTSRLIPAGAGLKWGGVTCYASVAPLYRSMMVGVTVIAGSVTRSLYEINDN